MITKENGTAINEAIPASKVQNKRNKSTKDLLQGVVVAKKRKGEEKDVGAEERSSKRTHVAEKTAAKNTTPAKSSSQKNLPTDKQKPIQSLVSYGDDSSSDEE